MNNADIRCRNCGKSTGISMKNMNINFNDIINQFVLNTMLHHVGMSWSIKKNQQLKYDIDKHNPDWITGGPWYNKSIFKNYMEQYLKIILEMQVLIDINLCVVLMHVRNCCKHL